MRRGVLFLIGYCLLVAVAISAASKYYWHGTLPDTDDYMRLTQVQDLLDGAAWWDLTQDRLNPPLGVEMHWSRLVDIPLAAVTLIVGVFLERSSALWLAAGLTPPLLFSLFLYIQLSYSRIREIGVDGPAILIVCAFAFLMLAQFQPGRVDHHGVQLTLMALATLFFITSIVGDRGWRPMVGAGIVTGLSLGVGLETLPYAIIFQAFIGLMYLGGRAPAAIWGAAFSFSQLASSLLAQISFASPSSWQTAQCDVVSPPYFLGMLICSVGWLTLYALGRNFVPWQRLVVGPLIGGFACLAVYLIYPACRQGPFSQVDPTLMEQWMPQVAEARPFLLGSPLLPAAELFSLSLPIGGLLTASAYAIFTTNPKRRMLMSLLFLLTAASAILALFFQRRSVMFSQMFAVIPLAIFIGDCLRLQLSTTLAKASRLLLLTSFLSAPLAAFALNSDEIQQSDRDNSAPNTCSLQGIDSSLLALSAAQPFLIAAPIDLGPELLFRTHHTVLGAPYHRNTEGIKSLLAIMRGNDERAVHALIREKGVKLILLCNSLRNVCSPQLKNTRNMFSNRLLEGHKPSWLSEVELHGSSLRAYFVRPVEPGAEYR